MKHEKELWGELLGPYFEDFWDTPVPANEVEIKIFTERLEKFGVPRDQIESIISLYEYSREVQPMVHAIDDEAIFEWKEEWELWLGQQDMDIFRWKDGRFHLWDASNVNYGDEYVTEDYYSILKKGFEEWGL